MLDRLNIFFFLFTNLIIDIEIWHLYLGMF